MTNIQNFKMSLYLQLSCRYSGHWVLPCVLGLSLLASLAIWLHCGQADSLCLARLSITVCQVLLALTLLAYLNVVSDLVTQNIRRLVVVADTEGGLASQVRDRLRALLVCWSNNSDSPVEEINLGGNTGNNTVADTDQNNSVMKDHIRWWLLSMYDVSSDFINTNVSPSVSLLGS